MMSITDSGLSVAHLNTSENISRSDLLAYKSLSLVVKLVKIILMKELIQTTTSSRLSNFVMLLCIVKKYTFEDVGNN
jgi:hypothetical protein